MALRFETCLGYPKQKIHCVFNDVSERVVLLSRHKIDVKEDITLLHDVNKNEDIKQLHWGNHCKFYQFSLKSVILFFIM